MQKEKKQCAGVCLDNAHAIIIAADSEATGYAILNKVKAQEHHGGGSEHSMNNAKQADSQKFFKSVSALLLNYDELLIFGPGKAQEQFQNFLKEEASFNNTRITIESAEHLTDPQMIARVRDFYSAHQS